MAACVLLICVPRCGNVGKRFILAMAHILWAGGFLLGNMHSRDGVGSEVPFLGIISGPRSTYCQLHRIVDPSLRNQRWPHCCSSENLVINLAGHIILSLILTKYYYTFFSLAYGSDIVHIVKERA